MHEGLSWPTNRHKSANHRTVPRGTEHPGRIGLVHCSSYVTAVRYWEHTQWTLISLTGKKKKTWRKIVFYSYWNPHLVPLWKPRSNEGVWSLRGLSHMHGGRCRHIPSMKWVGASQMGEQRGTHLELRWSLLTPQILKGQQGWKEDRHLQEGALRQELHGSSWVPTGGVLRIFLSQYQWHFPAGWLNWLIFSDAISSCLTLPRVCTGHIGDCLPGSDCSLQLESLSSFTSTAPGHCYFAILANITKSCF